MATVSVPLPPGHEVAPGAVECTQAIVAVTLGIGIANYLWAVRLYNRRRAATPTDGVILHRQWRDDHRRDALGRPVPRPGTG